MASPEGPPVPSYRDKLSTVRAKCAALLERSGKANRTTTRRMPRGLASFGVAATLSVAAVTTAAAVPPSAPTSPPPGLATPPPAAAPAAAAPANPEQSKILAIARGEIGNVETGKDCQKYSSKCVSWCALFAMSVWEKAGIDVDNEKYAFTGDVYTTGQEKGTAYGKDKLNQAKPGDVLLFGTGPDSPSSSKHIGIVEKVNGDKVTTIEGNTGDNPDRVMRKEHKLSPETFYGGVHPW